MCRMFHHPVTMNNCVSKCDVYGESEMNLSAQTDVKIPAVASCENTSLESNKFGRESPVSCSRVHLVSKGFKSNGKVLIQLVYFL